MGGLKYALLSPGTKLKDLALKYTDGAGYKQTNFIIVWRYPIILGQAWYRVGVVVKSV